MNTPKFFIEIPAVAPAVEWNGLQFAAQSPEALYIGTDNHISEVLAKGGDERAMAQFEHDALKTLDLLDEYVVQLSIAEVIENASEEDIEHALELAWHAFKEIYILPGDDRIENTIAMCDLARKAAREIVREGVEDMQAPRAASVTIH